GEITTLDDADNILHELEDRFGTPPKPTLFLYHLTRLRIIANQNSISLLQFKNHILTVERSNGKKGSILLPKFQSPKELEEVITKLLTV
ncbi:MAG: hypothetical protein KAR79_00780, partial [Simkaniaceae bacterium]|nr:hypothetical protein [Simkaniaceae bacterium]